MENKIVLSSSSKNSITLYLYFLVKILKKFNINYSIVNLPTTKKRITLLKSPHVNKKAKDQFEICYYKTIVCFDLKSSLDLIKNLIVNKPKSVSLKIFFTSLG